jgi:hypothetical protein
MTGCSVVAHLRIWTSLELFAIYVNHLAAFVKATILANVVG